MKKSLVLLSLSALMLNACGSGGGGSTTSSPTPNNDPPPAAPVTPISSELIKLNQVGYLPSEDKIVIVPNGAGANFVVMNTSDNSQVLSGQLSSDERWGPSNELVGKAELSSITASGEYTLIVEGFEDSHTLYIDANAYINAHDATLKAYYFNRASTALLPEHAGVWERSAGHPDDAVLVHASAASAERPEGTIISAPKGWYDAGDYNKYIVNSGISVYTLLAAYEHNSDFYVDREIGIPESGDQMPDILDEVTWNLDWMLAMQDPNDGGVYHKLTTLNFSGSVMPNTAIEPRFVVQKSTAAALNFAAVMAMASRIYDDFPEYSAAANQYKEAAITAWQWAKANPNVAYAQPSDVSTGEYGDSTFSDEFAWTAAELFVLTGESVYLDEFKQIAISPSTPSWSNTAALGFISLLHSAKGQLSDSDYQGFLTSYIGFADSIVAQHQQSAYGVAMVQSDFVWGSNAVALNKTMVLLQAQRLSNDDKYKQAAIGLVDYVLGRNPTDYSYLTGFGAKTPMDIHHRQSHADDVSAPVPGFVAGGAQPGQQDNCSYPSTLAAKSYVDDWCSYSTNEVTINWNAPLVYALATLHNMQ